MQKKSVLFFTTATFVGFLLGIVSTVLIAHYKPFVLFGTDESSGFTCARSADTYGNTGDATQTCTDKKGVVRVSVIPTSDQKQVPGRWEFVISDSTGVTRSYRFATSELDSKKPNCEVTHIVSEKDNPQEIRVVNVRCVGNYGGLNYGEQRYAYDAKFHNSAESLNPDPNGYTDPYLYQQLIPAYSCRTHRYPGIYWWDEVNNVSCGQSPDVKDFFLDTRETLGRFIPSL